jgi:predicted nucleic acid-binding protein
LIVVDASSVVELLLRTEAAERIDSRLRGERRAIHAPHLLDPEVLQAIRG